MAPKPSTETSSSKSISATDITQSASEIAAIKAQKDFLAEMAAQGIFPEEAPTQVTVKYHRSGITVGLYNEAYVTQADYYQQQRKSADYKVIPNIEMGALLKSLEEANFFDGAVNGIKRFTGASISIILRKGKDSYTLAYGPTVQPELLELTHACSDNIRLMYDTTRSIQVVENPDGSDYFEKERARINEKNRERLEKKPR
jgi:hypothetical protein